MSCQQLNQLSQAKTTVEHENNLGFIDAAVEADIEVDGTAALYIFMFTWLMSVTIIWSYHSLRTTRSSRTFLVDQSRRYEKAMINTLTNHTIIITIIRCFLCLHDSPDNPKFVAFCTELRRIFVEKALLLIIYRLYNLGSSY